MAANLNNSSSIRESADRVSKEMGLDHEALFYIKALHAAFLTAILEFDGGVKEENMQKISRTAPRRLVMGSAILHADRHPAEAYTYLRNIFLQR